MAVVFLLFCLVVQALSGTWNSDFGFYPDEPSHFVGSAMVRDWLVSGQWRTPFQFARAYYDHYPYIAIGYWPPLFNILTGLWMLLAGVGRTQALVIPAICAAGTSWLVFRFVRERTGLVAATCAGFVYLSVPAVRQWMCTVMVDHMTAFLTMLTGYCFLGYVRKTSLFRACLLGVVCGLAVLSKFSAGYVLGLPFALVLLRRNWKLLADWRFWAGPVSAAAMVLPWIVFTQQKSLCCSNGLSSAPDPLNAHRVYAWIVETFTMFPPVVLVPICAGLLLLLFRRRAWNVDVFTLAFLYTGHLALFIIAPVFLERRYLLTTSAVLVTGAFIGWSSLPTSVLSQRIPRQIIPATLAILTTALVIWQFRSPQMQPARLRQVVERIVQDPRRTNQKIVVPPELEGAAIAEFVVQTPVRPGHVLLRPSKILARMDWFGVHYESLFSSSDELMQYFQKNPVNLMIWNRNTDAISREHAVLMGAMLEQYPSHWHAIFEAKPRSKSDPAWVLYEYSADPR